MIRVFHGLIVLILIRRQITRPCPKGYALPKRRPLNVLSSDRMKVVRVSSLRSAPGAIGVGVVSLVIPSSYMN